MFNQIFLKIDKYLPLATAWLLVSALIICSPSLVQAQEEAEKEHEKLILENRFPAAATCRTCHPDHYREWSVSAHAYAQLSPVFNAMHATIMKQTNGTNGDFCVRCHTQVGMNLKEAEFMSNMDRHPTSREGITCVICHRVDKDYGKVSGRLGIVEGDIFEAVYGPTGNKELKRVITSGEYNINTERGKSGRAIHTDVELFKPISTPAFCGSCHDVNLVNGFRLEEAFSDFKTSPAAGKGTTCQECHMGKEPGKKSGFAVAPAAIVGGKPTTPRKRTNHMFAGPDYSVIHPAFFPHNTNASAMATMREWLTFDHKAGWGTDAFENNVPAGFKFPPRWTAKDDRYDARDIINENLKLLKEIEVQRLQVLQAGYQLGAVVVDRADAEGIKFKVEFKNAMDGHSVPTGFDAERVVYLEVTVTDNNGKVVFRSGDMDPNGDLRDPHSLYVHNGELPRDKYLFSLQSKFIVRMVRGGEREQILAVNYSPSALPFLRPSTSSTILLGRPVGARKHRQVIPPLQSEWPKYEVTRSELAGSTGPYKAKLKIIAGMVPVNLVDEIKGVGFDYNMSAKEVAEGVLAGHLVVGEREITLTKGRFTSDQAPSAKTNKLGSE
ncbi:cytochrome c family protein [candidate division KSB1 bacterium]|nr:cytochrome c family protein [candidate division KSB1 bacterium]